MKFSRILTLLAISLFLFSCSNTVELNEVDASGDAESVNFAINTFKSNFSTVVNTHIKLDKTRLEISDADMYESYQDSIGNIVIADLLPSSTKLMEELGIEPSDFNEIDSLYGIPADFMSVYFAMGVMEASDSYTTRANAEDIVSCIALGQSYGAILGGGAKFALRKCAQQLAKRMVPYIGCGWAIAEAAACISRL